MFVLTFSCSKEDPKVTNDVNLIIPSGVINQERAIELSETWSAKTSELLSKANATKSSNQAKSLWWSLEDLRNYLEYAEYEAIEKGYNMTGVRVYFGAYPEKQGQNTLFFAPTGYKNVSEASSMFGLFLPPTDNDIPVPPLNQGHGGYGGYPQ